MSKDNVNWDRVKWKPFEEVKLSGAPDGSKTFVNSIYQVEAYGKKMPLPLGDVVWLSFKTRDRQPRHNWREMQQMKNEVLTLLGLDGEHVEAVEIFPDEDRLVDTCNQYHLWCFPFAQFEGHPPGRLPFGYAERLVSEGSAPGGRDRLPGCSRQTNFRPELRPPDTLDVATLAKLTPADTVVGRCPICGAGFKEVKLPDAVGWVCLKFGHSMHPMSTVALDADRKSRG